MSELTDATKKIRAKKHELIAALNNHLSEFTDETGVVVTNIDMRIIVDERGQQQIGYVASIKVEV